MSGFVEALEFVQGGISTDQTRYYLNGAHLKSLGDSLDVVATDGHILFKTNLKTPLLADCIVAKGTVKTILKVFEGQVKIATNKTKIKMCGGGYELLSKLIGGEFPDYNKVIPKKSEFATIQIDGKALSGAIKQVEPAKTRLGNRPVKFIFKNGKLSLESDIGKASIDCSGDLETGFDATRILSICKVFGNFTMNFKEDFSGYTPALIEGERGLAVLMPIRF